ncbi:hypothetical protein PAXINDRAFT_68135, partial [Paxillus involutus ATCC 200175]
LAKLFDYCLTFPSEVHHAWGRKWDITRIVFTISRYLSFVASAMMCFSISNVCIISAEVILILRTYALWRHSRRVLVVLMALGVSLAFRCVFLIVHEIVLQGMNTWRKFRTYRDVQSPILNTLYWDGIMYMFWIIRKGHVLLAHTSCVVI